MVTVSLYADTGTWITISYQPVIGVCAHMGDIFIDKLFHGWDKGKRHDYAWTFLQDLPEDTLEQISVLLCLEPGESMPLDIEFRESIPSRP